MIEESRKNVSATSSLMNTLLLPYPSSSSSSSSTSTTTSSSSSPSPPPPNPPPPNPPLPPPLPLPLLQTFQEADRRCWDGMVREWGREKERILDSLLGPGQELDFPSEIAVREGGAGSLWLGGAGLLRWVWSGAPCLQVLHSSPLSLRHRSSLNAVGMAYARAVFVRNEAAMQGLPHSLVTAFHQASTSFVDKVVPFCRVSPLTSSLLTPSHPHTLTPPLKRSHPHSFAKELTPPPSPPPAERDGVLGDAEGAGGPAPPPCPGL